jgi:hypothetical protein
MLPPPHNHKKDTKTAKTKDENPSVSEGLGVIVCHTSNTPKAEATRTGGVASRDTEGSLIGSYLRWKKRQELKYPAKCEYESEYQIQQVFATFIPRI